MPRHPSRLGLFLAALFCLLAAAVPRSAAAYAVDPPPPSFDRIGSYAQGQFLTTDPINDADPVNPHTWNKYGFVRGNPLRYSDPDGRAVIYSDKKTQAAVEARARKNRRVAEVLARHAGPDQPDLRIFTEDPGADIDGEPALGITQVLYERHSIAYDERAILGAAQQGGEAAVFSTVLPETGANLVGAAYDGATVKLRPGMKGAELADLIDHELAGHVFHAMYDPIDYLMLGACDMNYDSSGKPINHDARPIEKLADWYAAEGRR